MTDKQFTKLKIGDIVVINESAGKKFHGFELQINSYQMDGTMRMGYYGTVLKGERMLGKINFNRKKFSITQPRYYDLVESDAYKKFLVLEEIYDRK